MTRCVHGGVPGGVLTPLEVLTTRAGRSTGGPSDLAECPRDRRRRAALRPDREPGRHVRHHRHPRRGDGEQRRPWPRSGRVESAPRPCPGSSGSPGDGPIATGLQPRRVRPLPADVRPHRRHHVLAAGPGVPLRCAGRQGRAAQPALAGAPPSACSPGSGRKGTAPRPSSASPPPGRSPSGYRSWSSPSCSGCRWTTRCSSSPGSARSTTTPATPTGRLSSRGSGAPGRLVTCAALILFLAFASLASAPDTDIKVLATGLGAGILLDATVVRAPAGPGPGVGARAGGTGGCPMVSAARSCSRPGAGPPGTP